MPTHVCLIVPCYNEADRLDFAQLKAVGDGVVCLLVDDGSQDGTADLIRRHQSDRLQLLQLPRNVGKAEAIRQGYLHARRQGWLTGAEWIGYWDADLATPLTELEHLLAYAEMSGIAAEAIFGSRIYKLGSHIVRSYRRHALGRLFTTVTATLLQLDCYDSQCGAKLFRPSAASDAFRDPFISRWIFDVEILVRLRGRQLLECPLRQWVDVKGSKLNPLKVAFPTLVDMIRIRRRYGPGRRP